MHMLITEREFDIIILFSQGWGVSVVVGVPHSEAVFATNPVNFLNERTLKGTFFGNYKPRSDLPGLVELYLNKVRLQLFFNDAFICLLDFLSRNGSVKQCQTVITD